MVKTRGDNQRRLHAVDGFVEQKGAAEGRGDEVGEDFGGPGGEPAADKNEVEEVEREGRELGGGEEGGGGRDELGRERHEEHPECGRVAFDNAGARRGLDAAGVGEGLGKSEGDGGVVPGEVPKAELDDDLCDEGDGEEGAPRAGGRECGRESGL